ncbi:NAD(P)H-binding protein [Olivibacter sp. SDN3]|uniref:NmrA family NAD(P)-binding protein n=1 Tax=Olivibacter sp. SDN3 TaxID=2764720 RepID=UPI001650FE72|nr:NAD(P)H-binding protein [Olivibacter sp. SDN3]QNL47971.1 NAD(P)H-binding protein [Olivibacter sp. SDN3]
MKVTVTGSLGNISRILIEKLVAIGHEVKVVSSNVERAKEIERLNAIPNIGRADDLVFVNTAFKDADVVYTMVPPSYGTTALIKKVGDIYASAIKANEVSRVVNLSGIGAHLPDGPGPSSANFYIENLYNSLSHTNVLHLRPGMFYSNFYGAMALIRTQNIIGNNFDENVALALTHPRDIADVALEAMTNSVFGGNATKYVVSDEITGKEIAEKLGKAIGNPDLKWIQFSDEEMFQGLLQQGMSEQMATTYIIDTGKALRNGSLLQTYFTERTVLLGKTNFDDFAKEFSVIYNSKF